MSSERKRAEAMARAMPMEELTGGGFEDQVETCATLAAVLDAYFARTRFVIPIEDGEGNLHGMRVYRFKPAPIE